MEITLDDLVMLEPRLAWDGEARSPRDAEEQANAGVSWAVSARTTPPHLPLLRGGEVVLVSARVTATLGPELPALLREAELRGVSAVIFERGDIRSVTTYPSSDDPAILVWSGDLSAETETGINRQLTEWRGNLYRVGSELERLMTDLTANRAGLVPLVRAVSRLSALPMLVADVEGRTLAESTHPGAEQGNAGHREAEMRIEREVPGGLRLILGPLLPEQTVTARFLVDRIATAVGVAARRDDAARPRGARRAEAVANLLAGHSGNGVDLRAAAMDLGLNPDAVFFVAITAGGHEAAVAKTLALLGAVHPAGEANGRRTALVAAHVQDGPESLAGRVSELKRRWEAETDRPAAMLALSGPAHGVARLPAAAREAAFVAGLQARIPFPRRAVSFESVDDIGAFRLLYHLRDSDELRQFVSDALGTLEGLDQRGTLRSTLRAFLECGGSQVDAAECLGIHRNTLAYRLRRIEDLIGRDVANPGSWLTLHLALRASEMLDIISGDR